MLSREFAALRTPSGKPADLTIAQLLTHTSGLGEGDGGPTLSDLVPVWVRHFKGNLVA